VRDVDTSSVADCSRFRDHTHTVRFYIPTGGYITVVDAQLCATKYNRKEI